MMRLLSLSVFLLLSATVSAQLRIPEAEISTSFAADAGAVTFRTRVPAQTTMHSLIPLARATPFQYADTKPYLAFFCRLELNIEEVTHFPIRFRLGEVRGWQQELTKRD